MEAFACARLRLCIARGDFESGRELAAAPDRAMAHVAEYLRLYARAGYARPLARERELAAPPLSRIVDANGGSEMAATAASLRGALASEDRPPGDRVDADLTGAEFEVLRRLVRHSDKEIARHLSLSYDAVRYRIRSSVFGKLGARGRHDAVHRARSLGILPSDDAG